MDITIKARCPNCRENIIIGYRSEQKKDENQKTWDSIYPMNSLTLDEAAKKVGFFDEFFNILGPYSTRKEKALDCIKDYFYTLKGRIELTKDRKELLEIQKSLSKLKAKVSDKVVNEIEDNKKEVIYLVKKKIKWMSESKNKQRKKPRTKEELLDELDRIHFTTKKHRLR